MLVGKTVRRLRLSPVMTRVAMPICRDFRAINRGAAQAQPGAALILGGLLLLSVP